jgi:hypothetical protein
MLSVVTGMRVLMPRTYEMRLHSSIVPSVLVYFWHTSRNRKAVGAKRLWLQTIAPRRSRASWTPPEIASAASPTLDPSQVRAAIERPDRRVLIAFRLGNRIEAATRFAAVLPMFLQRSTAKRSATMKPPSLRSAC